MIIFRIRQLAEQKGITTAYQLHMAMNIPPMTARRWWKHEEMKYIDASSLERLCEYFSCEPGDIIKRVPNVAAQPAIRKTKTGGQK